MSILLDALRKSEQQRRLGSTPSIHGGPERQPAGGDSAQQWVPLSLIALSAIAIAWIGWQQYQQPTPLAQPDAPAGVAADRAIEAVGGKAVTQGERDPGGPAAEAGQAAPEDPRLAPRTPVETFAQGNKTPQVHPDMASTEAPPSVVKKVRVRESFQAYESEPQPGGDEARQSEPASNTGGADVVFEPPQAGQPGADSEVTASPEPQRAASEPITYWELPQGVRDSLPELRISVLVYAEQPQDRFLLMSGQRMVEKDEYEGGVVLDEIRRDGAVFLYRKYRFLVKG
jgi:general secretion pathway protein B